MRIFGVVRKHPLLFYIIIAHCIGLILMTWAGFEWCLQASQDPYRWPPHHFWYGFVLFASELAAIMIREELRND